MEVAAKPFNEEIEFLETQKCEPQKELDLAAKHRIQDALDNWHGAQLLFDRHLDKFMPVSDQETTVRADRGGEQDEAEPTA